MADSDDDPYLAELLDLTNDELGDAGDSKPKAAASASSAAAAASSSSQASFSSAAKARASSSSAAAAAAASSSQQSPAKPPSYRSSDTHRETLKLLSQLSPSMAKLPSDAEVRAAFQELYGAQAEAGDDEDDDEFEEVDATRDEEKVQRALEEHLDVADLGPRASVIREEMRKLAAAKAAARERRRQQQEQGLSQSLSMSQASLLGDEPSQTNGGVGGGGGKKRKRVAVPGGKSALPLVLPKGLVTAPEGAPVSKKGPKSLLVKLDERDKGQDLTGDSGAVGRVHVSKKRGMVLDLKGHQYLAHMTRCPALLLVSVGEEEAKVEDVVQDLCVLTHLRDHMETLGGQVVKGSKGGGKGAGGDDDSYRGSDEEDYSRFNNGDSDDSAGGGKGKGKGKAAAKKGRAVTTTTKPAAARKKGAGAGKGKGKKGGGGGGGRKSAAGAAKKKKPLAKKAGPTKVSLKALGGKKKKRKRGSDSDEDSSEESFSEPDDDDDSDFSI